MPYYENYTHNEYHVYYQWSGLAVLIRSEVSLQGNHSTSTQNISEL